MEYNLTNILGSLQKNMARAKPCGLPLILIMRQMHFLPEAFDLSGLLLAIMRRTQLRKRANIFEFKIGSASLNSCKLPLDYRWVI